MSHDPNNKDCPRNTYPDDTRGYIPDCICTDKPETAPEGYCLKVLREMSKYDIEAIRARHKNALDTSQGWSSGAWSHESILDCLHDRAALLAELDAANERIAELEIANRGYSDSLNRANCTEHSFMEMDEGCMVCQNKRLHAAIEAAQNELAKFKPVGGEK